MKSDLILITRQFPYGSKETFLESEIEIISRYFNKIIIYPATNHTKLRTLPDNVVVNDFICKDYKSKFKWIPKTIFTFDFLYFIYINKKKMRSINEIGALFKYIISYTIYKNKIRIIDTQNTSNFYYSYWYSPFVDAFCNLNLTNKTIITRVHGGDLYEERSIIGCFPNRDETISKVKEIFAISNHGVNHIKNRFNVNNVSLSRLGIFDLKIISKPSENSCFSIVSVSDIIPLKNLPLIAKSIIHFAAKHPNLKISWNHFGDGVGKKELVDIISQGKSKNLNCILNGIVKNSEVLNFYVSYPVDLLINLSESEGIPVSMMEAISFGVSLIGTDVGGVSEIVNDTTGILIDIPINIEFVSDQICAVYNSPKDRKSVRNYFLENYSAENNYSNFSNKILDLCQV
jgi:glycosyltransferase involved in cell wall biosynthesis